MDVYIDGDAVTIECSRMEARGLLALLAETPDDAELFTGMYLALTDAGLRAVVEASLDIETGVWGRWFADLAVLLGDEARGRGGFNPGVRGCYEEGEGRRFDPGTRGVQSGSTGPL